MNTLLFSVYTLSSFLSPSAKGSEEVPMTHPLEPELHVHTVENAEEPSGHWSPVGTGAESQPKSFLLYMLYYTRQYSAPICAFFPHL